MKILLSLAFILVVGCDAGAERHVHLNGEHLEAQGIAVVDRLLDKRVADGNYWINDEGQWGYEDNPTAVGTVNLKAAVQMQAEQMNVEQAGAGQQVQGGGGQQVHGGGGYVPPGGTEINTSQNGSVVTGNVGGKKCTYVSAGGMTMKSCD